MHRLLQWHFSWLNLIALLANKCFWAARALISMIITTGSFLILLGQQAAYIVNMLHASSPIAVLENDYSARVLLTLGSNGTHIERFACCCCYYDAKELLLMNSSSSSRGSEGRISCYVDVTLYSSLAWSLRRNGNADASDFDSEGFQDAHSCQQTQ